MSTYEERLQGLASGTASLQQTIVELHRRLDEVTAERDAQELESPDVEHSEPHVREVMRKLEGQRIADLRRSYNREFFEGYSMYARYVVARALVRLAAAKNAEPDPLWHKLEETLGKM